MKLSRRNFLKASGAIGAVGAMSTVTGCMAEEKKPNVLMICIDDLNDWIGGLRGHVQAYTPNIDKLMAKSTNFTNAHCAVPVCGPSRNATFTGMRPETTGWYTNKELGMKNFDQIAEKVLGKTPTLPQHFKANGYTTLACGKIFHHGTSDYRAELQWDLVQAPYEIKNPEFLLRGFGYGQYGVNDHKYYPFPEDGGQIVTTFGPNVAGKSMCWGALDADDIPMGGKMPDEYFADWAIEQLQNDYEKPFLLATGFVRPHMPYTAPKEYFDMFPLDSIQMPELTEDEMKDIPLYGKAMALGVVPGLGDHGAVEKVSPTFWKELVRANLACIAFVDAQIGRVLEAFEQSKYKDNTIVTLWSDHGQNFGEHRNWRKNTLWEESTRIPLVIRRAGQTNGAECKQAVSLMDYYPTLVQLCGLPEVTTNEGLSLVPLLNSPEFDRKAPAVTTWGFRNHAVRDERWRYIRYRDGSEELYDHTIDPNEHHNIAADSQFDGIKKELAQWIPASNILPYGMEDFSTGDFLEKRIQEWEDTQVPEFLL
ncbi:DUF229 domain-containing protein [Vibrio alfacsensis]|uniref:DUF229 domain-containing protein n=1 Tax=Vibrio alfacsensis TaxID=1074311 RepID=A0ABM6YX52_9VIBR|nr:sulfatase-like hydrolase/transferase [Vibrio alfacsensis]AXY02463.1 DUF229 domain-containing protein [Vibrio alfacsensis]